MNNEKKQFDTSNRKNKTNKQEIDIGLEIQ